ncbi:hypothetical protein L6164_032044 [Bauhinia variegata]|uniref:Uncharacterized protein n=1 Tax=Bauhinia variegata TaxID=167791 RepID=A0ACB9KMI5_BAUVA|nr:hypothetical protein L6164_032044 [Bauhinia variegata]
MSISGIQGHLLEVTVVGCNKLKDTEWISRQDPYVCLEYGSTKFRTRTHTDGGKNPVFQEKYIFSLIEGLRELNVIVWNSNTLTYDDFIGSGKVQLYKVLSQGFDDSAWPIQTQTGRHAGEVKLMMHYANSNVNKHSSKLTSSYAPSAPAYAPPPNPQVHLYSAPPAKSYPPQASAPSYPPIATAYPASSSYPPYSSAYPPPPYPPPPAAYPPPPYPPTSAYPPSPYPPPSNHYPPGPYPGVYPPPY